MIDKFLSIQEVIKQSNIGENPSNRSLDVDYTDMYKLIHRFYNERGDVNPETYLIKKNNETIRSRTTLGRPLDNKMPIEEIDTLSFHHSHFSSDGLNIAGINQEESWNGEKAGIQYENGTLEVIKSDYYTTRTFSMIPHIEATHVLHESEQEDIRDVDLDRLSIRNQYLRTNEEIQRTRWLASGGSVNGVLLVNTGDEWKIILGRRSERTNINPGRVSVMPSGGLRYDNMAENGFVKDLKMHFNEEIFRGQRQPNYFKDFVEPYRVSSGWNLRSGELSVGYALLVRDPRGYNHLKKSNNYNFEFNDVIEIPVDDYERLSSTVRLENMSPSIIPTVFRSIALLDNLEDDLDLGYTIDQEL